MKARHQAGIAAASGLLWVLASPAIMTLYESTREPREIIWLPGLHVQSNRKDVLQGLVKTVLQRSGATLNGAS